MQIRDIMTPDVRWASPDATVAEIAAEMKRLNVGAIPICDAQERLVGIITDRDITVECAAAGLNPTEYKVREFMTAEPITIRPDAPITELVRLMAREQVHRVPVTNDGRLVGMVSIGDLAVHFTDEHALAELFRSMAMPVRSFVA